MKVCDNIFRVTGVEYETNSNIYAITYATGIVLIDAGYQEEQWDRMIKCMKMWDLNLSQVTHVFLTHSHFDHAGNVWRMNQQGIKVLASSDDTQKIEDGNPEMEELFKAKWICGRVDQIISDGDIFEFSGGVKITALETPGHCPGCMSYLIEVKDIKALCTGDMLAIDPVPPEDKVDVGLGYMGSSDFCIKDYIQSLKKITDLEVDVLLPGHYYFYRGENIKQICQKAYEKAKLLEV